MSSNTLLSIVIPLYNSEKYIEKVVNNLLLVDQKNLLEIVLVDDGSKDQTSIICSELVKKCSLVKYYYKENGGIDTARNFGIEMSAGKYIMFHDHDDFADVKTLNYFIEKLSANDEYDIFIFNSSRIEGNKRYHALKLNDGYISRHNCVANNYDLINKVCHHKENHKIANRLGYVWSMIIKRDFIVCNNICFKKRVNYEDDLTFCIKLFSNKPKTYLCNKNIYNWMMYHSSTSHSSKYDPLYFNKVNLLEEDLKHVLINEQNKNELVSDVLWGFYYNFLIFYCQKNTQASYFQFVNIFSCQHLRDKLLSFKKREFDKKQKLAIILIYLKLYRVLFYIFIK